MDKSLSRRARLLDAVSALVVGVEALAVAAVGAGYLVYALVGQPQDVPQVVVFAVLALALAGALAATAVALWRYRRWSRSAGGTWQLLQAAVASLYSGPQLGIAVALWAATLVAGAAIVGAAYAQARAHTGEDALGDS